MRVLSIISLLLLIAFQLSSQDLEEAELKMAEANQLYEEGKITEAISAYSAIEKLDFTSKQLHYNLGNAHYRSNAIPLAILHFERALRYAPTDPDILHNLDQARLLTVDKMEVDTSGKFSDWWTSKLLAVGAGTWASFSIIAVLLTLFFAGLYIFMRKKSLRQVGLTTGLVTLALTFIFLWFSLSAKSALLSTSEAIIYTAKVEVMSAPNQNSTELFVLHEGTKVEVLRDSDGWYEVKLSNGSVGWLEGKHMMTI